jgi:hypothetical protein
MNATTTHGITSNGHALAGISSLPATGARGPSGVPSEMAQNGAFVRMGLRLARRRGDKEEKLWN